MHQALPGFINPGAYDPDGDSLSFELFVPKQDVNLDVAGYAPPNSRKFYDVAGIPYKQANEQQDNVPTFEINSVTGTITWDAPGEAGEYNIACPYSRVAKGWRNMGFARGMLSVICKL